MDAELGTELVLSAAADLAFYSFVEYGDFQWFAGHYPAGDGDYVLKSASQSLDRAFGTKLFSEIAGGRRVNWSG